MRRLILSHLLWNAAPARAGDAAVATSSTSGAAEYRRSSRRQQLRFNKSKCREARLLRQQACEYRLLGMQTVLRLLEDFRLGTIHDRVGYLIAAVGRQAVHDNGARFGGA